MSEELYITAIILLMSAVTYLPRALPMQMNLGERGRSWDWIDFVPASIVAAVVIGPMIVVDQKISVSVIMVLSAALTALVAMTFKNVLVTVVSGTVIHMALSVILSFPRR